MSGKRIQFHTLSLDIKKDITVTLIGQKRENILSGTIGKSLNIANFSIKQDRECVELQLKGTASLSIKHTSRAPGCHRYDFSWTLMDGKIKELAEEFEMRTHHWYGVAQINKQTWPVEKWQRASQPFVCWDSYRSNQYGSVQERYWLSSSGAAIFVTPDVPLFAGTNEKGGLLITLASRWASPFHNPQKRRPFLTYTLLQHENVQEVHLYAVNEILGKPSAIPDETMFRHPVWSTWGRYKKEVNQQQVMQFSKEIMDHGFKVSVMEIDDDWTPSYGDYEFHKKKFSGAFSMIKALGNRGHRVNLWVHPFASSKSDASGKPFWLKGKLKGTTTWWNGLGKCLDVTNPAGVAWYKGSLKHLQDMYGVYSFKFDAGETNWLPTNFESTAPCSSPNEYTTKYAELCAAIDTTRRAQKVRVGVRTQHLPMWVRMVDKDSNWTYDNGLKTLIPNALTFSSLGYVFCFPDTIGGQTQKGIPERELYIRWMEVCAFMPVMQFSIPPWQYDAEVVTIAKRLCELHERWADTLLMLARNAVRTGEPIIRPIWWLMPDDKVAQTIDSQFLVGNDLLVAPILEKGATSRAIYLPTGTWQDERTMKHLVGGRWYYGYPAKLGELPHFSRFVVVEEPPPEPIVEPEPDPEPEPEPEPEPVPEPELPPGPSDDTQPDEPGSSSSSSDDEPEQERELAGELSRAELIARLEKIYINPDNEESEDTS